MGRPYRANPDTENDACRRASQSQAPAMRRPARTAKPQGRIPEHEASFQTRGPHRSRRRREQERRISRSSQEKSRTRREWARLNAPFPAFGGGLGCAGLRASGAGPGRAARSAVALRHGAPSARHLRRRCGRAALARSPCGSVRSSALAARRSPSRTYRSYRAERPARPCWHIGRSSVSGRCAT